MSVISTHHSFVPFVSAGAGKSKAYDGQRLAKVVYKTRGNAPESERKQSVCVSVPVPDREYIAANLDNFLDYVVEMYKGAQDGIVRELYEAKAVNVSDEDIDLPAVVSYLEKTARGGRLTSEGIKAWFSEVLSEVLCEAVAEKMGMTSRDLRSPEQCKKLERMANAYADSFGALAGYRTLYDNEKCDKLLKALALCEDDNDVIANGLAKRLQDMKLVAQSVDSEYSL